MLKFVAMALPPGCSAANKSLPPCAAVTRGNGQNAKLAPGRTERFHVSVFLRGTAAPTRGRVLGSGSRCRTRPRQLRALQRAAGQAVASAARATQATRATRACCALAGRRPQPRERLWRGRRSAARTACHGSGLCPVPAAAPPGGGSVPAAPGPEASGRARGRAQGPAAPRRAAVRSRGGTARPPPAGSRRQSGDPPPPHLRPRGCGRPRPARRRPSERSAAAQPSPPPAHSREPFHTESHGSVSPICASRGTPTPTFSSVPAEPPCHYVPPSLGQAARRAAEAARTLAMPA